MIFVNNDVDPFNETEVFWTVATHVQTGADVEILRRVRGGTPDPTIP